MQIRCDKNDQNRPASVMAAMSGGVDSSVCALLLRDAGCSVCGATGKMYGSNVMGDDWEAQSAWLETIDDAKRVCRKLGIPHYTFNLKEPFARCVIERFVDGYLRGETPNPCVDCNRFVKFDALQQRRAEMGCDYLATGHYARVRWDEASGRWQLLRGVDEAKDQSYFLAHLTQEQLAHTLFPLGDLTKSEVRKLAADAGFSNAERAESQDICFVLDGDYRAFIKRWHDRKNGPSSACTSQGFAPGPVVNADGKVIGEHTGLLGYTVGQRKGIGIAAAEPLYVIGKDADRNALIVGTHDELMTHDALAKNVNFVSVAPDAFTGNHRVLAKTNYRQQARPARASFDNDTLRVRFDEAIPRPAPGQTLVLYDAESPDVVLVGATLA